MNKRILSILLCLTLVASLLVLAVPVSAASAKEITVTADKTTAAPGDEITFTVSIGPVTDMACITTHVVIPDGLTLDESSISMDASAFKEKYSFENAAATYWKDGKAIILDGAGPSNVSTTESYDAYTFKCTVNDDATGILSVGFNNDEFVLGNESGADLTGEYTCTGVDITVGEPTPVDPGTEPSSETTPVDPGTEPSSETTPVDPGTEPSSETTPETTPETEAHVHNIIAVPEVAATTEAEGVKAHYECTECGKRFWDATGITEITDPAELVISKIDPKKPASNDSAATPDSTKDTSSPQTGDSTNMYLWTLIMIASLAGACAVVIIAKRRGIFTK